VTPPKSGIKEGNCGGKAATVSVGTIVGEKVGVERPRVGSVTTGETSGEPSRGTTVGEDRLKAGFCQIYTKALPRIQRINAPHPRPPIRNASNVERYFLINSIRSPKI
jgi:hypothetical protein